MKSRLIIILILINIVVFGQNDSVFFIDEINISINRTNLENNNTTDGFGFGIGAYHTFLSDKLINILFGFEYNRTRQFKESIHENHFSNATDLTYYINSLSIPINARINIGKRVKFFGESGIFSDINIVARRTGTMHTYLPDENNQLVIKEFEIDEPASISGFNYGFSIGIGVKIPISNFHLIIKSDYKFGIKALYDYQDQIYNRYFRIMLGVKYKWQNKKQKRKSIDLSYRL